MSSTASLTACRICQLFMLHESAVHQQEIKQWRGLHAGEVWDVMQTDSSVMQRNCRPIA